MLWVLAGGSLVYSDQARQKGKSLAEITGKKFITIYRATVEQSFRPMDYVTLSKKFATGHAEHTAVVNEESCNVLLAVVETSYVFEAPNPGEYFYDGPETKGRVILAVDAPI